MAEKLILIHEKSPGDIVCLSGLVRDIHLAYPGRYEIQMQTTCRELWQNNPNVVKLPSSRGAKRLRIDYGRGIKEQNYECIHFLAYFHRVFHQLTGVEIPCQKPYGDLHLTESERLTPPVSGRYWAMMAGGKSDAPVKVWDLRKFQEVTDALRQMGLGVVQLGDTDKGHWHANLTGALSLVGKTGIREWIRVLQHADGVICGVTGAMHIAAALNKPCVVIAGGREAWWWEAYVNENKGFGPLASGKIPVPHRFLHTIGLLDCGAGIHGCWKNKVVYAGKDPKVCRYPVERGSQTLPKCMDLIRTEHVMHAVKSYYDDKTLPPIVPADPSELQQLPAPVIIDPATVRHARKVPIATKSGPVIQVSPDIIDHPSVGGKFTIFVLFYGPEQYYQLHQRCLQGLINSTTAQNAEIRVGSNALNPKSVELIAAQMAAGRVTAHYQHRTNDYKYPVMREMFHDPQRPITTKWVVWFDDDSIASREKNWLGMLSQAIVAHHAKDNAHLFGARFTHTMSPAQKAVFSARPWYKGRPWRLPNGRPAPNGSHNIFAAGGFWAITAEAIVAADIPDLGTGLTHNGGDWQIGEQVYQAGYNMKAFNSDKQYVHTSSVRRRGVTKPVPGDKR